MSLLTIEKLTVDIGDGRTGIRLLDGVSLRVEPGETVALVGESGSGKSLTARAVLGLLPTRARASGSIVLDGTHVLGASGKTLRQLRRGTAAMVFQDPRSSINPMRSLGAHLVEASMEDPGAVRGEVEATALELMGSMGLASPRERLAQYPHELSGGMLQRIMIAGAMMAGPRLLICDESTTALDVTTQAQVVRLLSEALRERGMGMLFITHDLGLAASLADRVYVLRHGRIEETGSTRDVFENASAAYTRELIAATPGLNLEKPEVPAPERGPAGPDAALVELRGVRRTYQTRTHGTVVALDGVDLAVHDGESVGIVGESGSGKSTLGRIVAGLESPDAGELRYARGTAPGNRRDARLARARFVQMVFQDPYQSLDPRTTAGAAVARVLKLHGRRPSREAERDRVLELLLDVGLEDKHAELHPRQLSGGQRQRLAIAKALAVDPRLLVLDEATSALDVSVQAQVLELIDTLRRDRGLAVLFISHDLAVVGRVCDRLLVVRSGRVVEAGPTARVLADPEHEYTKTLLASVPRPRWEARPLPAQTSN